MGDRAAAAALLRLEARRTFPLIARATALTAAGALPVALLRGPESELLALLLLGSGLSCAVQVPALVVRDRLGGELSLLAELPVTAGTVVAAKFAAAALAAAMGALHGAAAALVLRGGVLEVEPLAGVAVVFAWAWLALATGSFLSIALLARFDIEALASGPAPAAVLLLLGLTWLVERAIPDPWARIGWILDRPWLPEAAAGAGVAGAVVLSVVAFRTASRAIRRAGAGFDGPDG